MLNTVNNNIVDTTFETTTKQLYFLRTKRKMFSIFMQKKYIYIYIKILDDRYGIGIGCS